MKVGEGLHVRMPHAMRRSVVDNVLAAGDLALGGVLHFSKWGKNRVTWVSCLDVELCRICPGHRRDAGGDST